MGASGPTGPSAHRRVGARHRQGPGCPGARAVLSCGMHGAAGPTRGVTAPGDASARKPPPGVRWPLAGRGVWPALPAVAYLVVMLVLPLCVLLAFGFLAIERGRVVPGSLTLAHYRRILVDPLT